MEIPAVGLSGIGGAALDRAAGRTRSTDSFAQTLGQVLDQLQQLQAAADASALQLATGGEVELHDVMLALEKANLGFQLSIQVRNKLIEAYQEIMRMQL